MGRRIKKDDLVLVISGNHRPRDGQFVRGRVLAIDPKRNTALVEGVNMVKKHTKARSQNEQGGIVEKEAPIHLSNLMLVDPSAGNVASRFENVTTDAGAKVRRLKKTDNEV